jgi:hypothetical protein
MKGGGIRGFRVSNLGLGFLGCYMLLTLSSNLLILQRLVVELVPIEKPLLILGLQRTTSFV